MSNKKRILLLKQIICKRYNLKESNLRRLKKQQLVDIIVSKNVKVTPVGTTVTNNNILEVIEYLSDTKTNNKILEVVKDLPEIVEENLIILD